MPDDPCVSVAACRMAVARRAVHSVPALCVLVFVAFATLVALAGTFGRAVAMGEDLSGAGEHWAFQPIRRPEVPLFAAAALAGPEIRNPVDAFVRARLREEGVAPSPAAAPEVLLRRLSLDLRGLPPTPDELESFRRDSAPHAYERVVERFLASPQFGERWARHWLDVARYADSEGNEFDKVRPLWRYRDWVVDALNRDLPFDRFVIEQLAGDLLPDPTSDQLVATGFHRSSVGGGNSHPSVLVDRVNATGTAFLALTLGCAQCHDHKFDPISQVDYYRLYAFFNNVEPEAKLEFATAEEIARRDAIVQRVGVLQKELGDYETQLIEQLPAREAALRDRAGSEIPEEIRAIVSLRSEQRTNTQKKALLDFVKEKDAAFQGKTRALAEIRATEPKFPTALILRERKAEPPPTHVFVRGVFESKGEQVEPGVPGGLHTLPVEGRRPNRLDLARWLVSHENPLTARVAVNRIWQRYFGVGLVETADNFGFEGKPPSHPELLDWLASEFRDSGWSVKRLHRLIVTSATYRQSSHSRASLEVRDPDNRLLARQDRLRLEAEAIRDQALAIGGLLSLRMGGPGVFPHQPEGVMDGRADKSRWAMSPGDGPYRRGVYVHFWRLTPHPVLKLFDAPTSVESCVRRQTSNTPVQALASLNDPWFVECAVHFAERLASELVGGGDEARIDRAFRVALARSPTREERELLRRQLAGARTSFAADPERALRLCGAFSSGAPPTLSGEEAVERAAWIEVSRVLLNLDEVLHRA